jgi:hypothetical protein
MSQLKYYPGKGQIRSKNTQTQAASLGWGGRSESGPLSHPISRAGFFASWWLNSAITPGPPLFALVGLFKFHSVSLCGRLDSLPRRTTFRFRNTFHLLEARCSVT